MNFYNNFFQDLKQIEKTIWNFFIQGSANKRSYFNSPTIATFDNKAQNIRTLILRKAIYSDRTLVFYSDIRTEKVSDIISNNHVAIHVYDRKKNLQVQCFGKADIISNSNETKQIWTKLSNISKKNYMSKKKPGTKIKSFLLNHIVEQKSAYLNFCIIKISIDRILCLHLSRKGNRKAEFLYKKQKFIANWLVP